MDGAVTLSLQVSSAVHTTTDTRELGLLIAAGYRQLQTQKQNEKSIYLFLSSNR